jgi:hypothetical protein
MGEFIMLCCVLVLLGAGGAALKFLLMGAFVALFTPWPWAILAALVGMETKK